MLWCPDHLAEMSPAELASKFPEEQSIFHTTHKHTHTHIHMPNSTVSQATGGSINTVESGLEQHRWCDHDLVMTKPASKKHHFLFRSVGLTPTDLHRPPQSLKKYPNLPLCPNLSWPDSANTSYCTAMEEQEEKLM